MTEGQDVLVAVLPQIKLEFALLEVGLIFFERGREVFEDLELGGVAAIGHPIFGLVLLEAGEEVRQDGLEGKVVLVDQHVIVACHELATTVRRYHLWWLRIGLLISSSIPLFVLVR